MNRLLLGRTSFLIESNCKTTLKTFKPQHNTTSHFLGFAKPYLGKSFISIKRDQSSRVVQFFRKSSSDISTSCNLPISSQRFLHHSKIIFENSKDEDNHNVVNTANLDMSLFPQSRIRNFSVIAHIDHGKTSLSNRLLELTGTVTEGSTKGQPLDALQVEKERGITVKAHTTSMFYKFKGELYLLNLIDTPGHVDFGYEVSRSLAASQGALLIVDATQGVQAQTMANFFLAFDSNLAVIPIVNKIDLDSANPQDTVEQIQSAFGIPKEEAIMASAKNLIGIDQIIPAIIDRIPPPNGSETAPLKVLLFDNWFDKFRGVVCLVRVIDGVLKKGDKISSAATNAEYEVQDVGILYPSQLPTNALYTGQVGYVIAGMKTSKEARVGDTFYHTKFPIEPLPGFKPAKAMVFAGIYPVDNDELEKLKDAIQKLTLNDSSVSVQKESSDALGTGFRCGFLGLLHMDVFVQRLEQEYGITVIATAPTVPFKLTMVDGSEMVVTNPSQYPEKTSEIMKVEEPMINSTIIVPSSFLGPIMNLCQDRRGSSTEMTYIDNSRVLLRYKLPLSEITTNFYDKLKEITSGYASFDYDEAGYQETSIVKLNVMLNGSVVEPLSVLVHRSKAEQYGRELTSKLKSLIDRQLFAVAIQASIGNKVVAREDISALRKNVLAKCYGGDVTRKRKLLEKQKEGKKRMKRVGNIDLSQEAFMAVLKRD